MEEVPLPCVLNEHDVDRLLEALRREHGEAGRPDVALEIARGVAVTARRLEEAPSWDSCVRETPSFLQPSVVC